MSSTTPIAPVQSDLLHTLFGSPKVVIGVIHCRPLPGSPRYSGESVGRICDAALADAEAYVAGGVHGLIVENHGDIPFLKPDALGAETAAVMAVIADRVRQAFDVPIGVNILANGAIQALAVAKAAGAAFIRVNQWSNAYVANEGIVEGPAAAALRYRAWLHAADVKVFADVHVKHGAHAITADRAVAELARDNEFFDADVAIATGQRTGDSAALDDIREIASATALPVFVGSGVTSDNVSEILSVADGVIVASSLKHGEVWWNAVDGVRVRAFMERVPGSSS